MPTDDPTMATVHMTPVARPWLSGGISSLIIMVEIRMMAPGAIEPSETAKNSYPQYDDAGLEIAMINGERLDIKMVIPSSLLARTRGRNFLVTRPPTAAATGTGTNLQED
jgi:hypothetical protein